MTIQEGNDYSIQSEGLGPAFPNSHLGRNIFHPNATFGGSHPNVLVNPQSTVYIPTTTSSTTTTTTTISSTGTIHQAIPRSTENFGLGQTMGQIPPMIPPTMPYPWPFPAMMGIGSQMGYGFPQWNFPYHSPVQPGLFPFGNQPSAMDGQFPNPTTTPPETSNQATSIPTPQPPVQSSISQDPPIMTLPTSPLRESNSGESKEQSPPEDLIVHGDNGFQNLEKTPNSKSFSEHHKRHHNQNKKETSRKPEIKRSSTGTNTTRSRATPSCEKRLPFKNPTRMSKQVKTKVLRPDIICFSCNGSGHLARDCPSALSDFGKQVLRRSRTYRLAMIRRRRKEVPVPEKSREIKNLDPGEKTPDNVPKPRSVKEAIQRGRHILQKYRERTQMKKGRLKEIPIT